MTEEDSAEKDRIGESGDSSLPTGSDLIKVSDWNAIVLSLALSNREAEVIKLLFDGKSNKEIAADLDISAHTVHTYLVRLFRKLRVNNRAGLLVQVFAEYLKHISKTLPDCE